MKSKHTPGPTLLGVVLSKAGWVGIYEDGEEREIPEPLLKEDARNLNNAARRIQELLRQRIELLAVLKEIFYNEVPEDAVWRRAEVAIAKAESK